MIVSAAAFESASVTGSSGASSGDSEIGSVAARLAASDW